MNSIRTKTTLITVIAMVVAMTITAFIGINAIRSLGKSSSEQMLLLLCETGEKNLDHYFNGIEQSVALVSSFAETDLEQTDLSDLDKHMERVSSMFSKIADRTDGVLTYYYRIDPSVSKDVKGFWFVNEGGAGFKEHEVTAIEEYDTTDTSSLVWFTVPKSTGKPVWLPPYVTENLDVLVLSYNVPIYKDGQFIGVVGIELDYTTMANLVDNIRLYENGYAFINDAQGNIIYHPYIDVAYLTEENKPKVPAGLIDSKQIVRYDYEGEEKMACCMELSNGMRLNVSVPVSEINGNWKSLIAKTLVVCIILLIVFTLITIHFADSITKPLIDLTKAAEKAGQGDYDVSLEYHSNDEVGVLSKAFELLIARIKSDIAELNGLNNRLKEDNLSLEAATTKDSLTGVKNRFALRRDYEKYDDTNVHLMMLDIDDFKKVNDRYGHSVGDYLLRKVGDALSEFFGADYSYRYGGDEFLVIFPDVEEEKFKILIQEMEARLNDISLEEKKFPVHFSAGYVYGKTLLLDDLRLMLRQADELLYKAKGAGKDTFLGEEYDRGYALNIKKRTEEAFRRG
ncbi:MAG: diguanylate cyclase [Lachnospiraceae bacterium]|nr:diguanylate cyclase [Lachnospiraceae bacterium]